MNTKKTLAYPFGLEDQPEISGKSWLKILLGNILSLLFLTIPYTGEIIKNFWSLFPGFTRAGENPIYQPALATVLTSFSIVIIFLAINLGILQLVLGNRWHQLFKKIHLKDFGTIIIFTLLAYLVGSLFSLLAVSIFGHETNPADNLSFHHPGAWNVFLLARSQNLFQLLGEEFLALLPFLALLQWGKREKTKPRLNFWIALVLSSMLFAFYHLSTYGYNLGFALLSLTFTRMVLTGAYVKTKNIWVSFIVHYLFDLIGFLIAFSH